MATKASKKLVTADGSSEQVCFVISPIGKEGSETYDKFKEVLDYVIKPAIESSSMKLRVIRADDINHAGSFIKDIFDNILDSHLVIADLTGQNPNVFYELGVRHALSPRTIMIAQSLDDIPSDLREYRTIIYSTSAKGSKLFQERVHQFISDVESEPLRPDNPVLDRLPTLQINRVDELEAEVVRLKGELNAVLDGSVRTPTLVTKDTVKNRFKRICTLLNAQQQQHGNFEKTKGDGSKESYQVPKGEGNFNLYWVLGSNGKSIDDWWYVSLCETECDLERDFADIRLLMEACSKGQDVMLNFILVTNEDLSPLKQKITKGFTQIKKSIPAEKRPYFNLRLWDESGLKKMESELGLRVSLDFV